MSPRRIKVQTRWLLHRDREEVLDIERLCFEFPWQPEDFIRGLRQRNCIGRVAECDEHVVGFVIYELHKTRYHVLNCAVHPSWQLKGVGRQMMAELINKLSHQHRRRILLEVRERNVAAQLFFRQCGFRAISVLVDFYDDATEDAYLFEYRYGAAYKHEAKRAGGVNRIAGYLA